jgi:hypothetical protein
MDGVIDSENLSALATDLSASISLSLKDIFNADEGVVQSTHTRLVV